MALGGSFPKETAPGSFGKFNCYVFHFTEPSLAASLSQKTDVLRKGYLSRVIKGPNCDYFNFFKKMKGNQLMPGIPFRKEQSFYLLKIWHILEWENNLLKRTF